MDTYPARRLAAATAITVSAMLLVACSAAESSVPTATPDVAEKPTTSTKPTPERRPYTISFGGDVHFEGVLRTRLDADPKTALGPIAKVLKASDLAMVNLETAITTGGT